MMPMRWLAVPLLLLCGCSRIEVADGGGAVGMSPAAADVPVPSTAGSAAPAPAQAGQGGNTPPPPPTGLDPDDFDSVLTHAAAAGSDAPPITTGSADAGAGDEAPDAGAPAVPCPP